MSQESSRPQARDRRSPGYADTVVPMPTPDSTAVEPLRPKRVLTGGSIALLVVLACAARVVHLDADPHFPTWIGYIVDEGRWAESARNLALFGTTDGFAERVHLLLSPAYQAASYLAFRLFGVSFVSARATAAISGILIVVATYLALRRHVSTFALALGILILGFETNMLAESRMALPELPSVLGSLLAFMILVLGGQSRRNAFAAGLLVTLSVAMKGTSALVVPVFPLVILLDARGVAWAPRLWRCAAFLAGFALPLAAALGLAVAIGLVDLQHVNQIGSRFLGFLSLANPGVAIWAIFESRTHEGRNLMLLAAWFCSWLWLHRAPDAPALVRSLYLMSGLWAIWWLAFWIANTYSPGRYVVHFIVPATVNVMAGLTLADRGTLARIVAAFERSGELLRAARLVWLVLPTAILLTTILPALGPIGILDFSRVSSRVGAIAAIAALLVLATRLRPPSNAVIGGLLIAPVAAVLLWLAGRELGLYRHFWADQASLAGVSWAATLGLAYAASFLLAARPLAGKGDTALRIAVLALVAGPFAVDAAPPIVAPTYTIRDASRDLALRVTCPTEVRAMSAGSMFLGNTLRYRELTRNELNHDGQPYDILVLFEHNALAQRFLGSPAAARLTRLGTYRLQIHPRYELDEANDGPARISVYTQHVASNDRCGFLAAASAQGHRDAGDATPRHDDGDPAVGSQRRAVEREPVPLGR